MKILFFRLLPLLLLLAQVIITLISIDYTQFTLMPRCILGVIGVLLIFAIWIFTNSRKIVFYSTGIISFLA